MTLAEGSIPVEPSLGKTSQVLEGTVYRGVVYVTVTGKGGPYSSRVVINGPETPVQFKVPVKPLEVQLNAEGGMLAHDTLYNRSW